MADRLPPAAYKLLAFLEDKPDPVRLSELPAELRNPDLLVVTYEKGWIAGNSEWPTIPVGASSRWKPESIRRSTIMASVDGAKNELRVRLRSGHGEAELSNARVTGILDEIREQGAIIDKLAASEKSAAVPQLSKAINDDGVYRYPAKWFHDATKGGINGDRLIKRKDELDARQPGGARTPLQYSLDAVCQIWSDYRAMLVAAHKLHLDKAQEIAGGLRKSPEK